MTGWTGGQYSLWRIAFALYTASFGFWHAIVSIPIAFGWHASAFSLALFILLWTNGWPVNIALLGLVAAQMFLKPPYLSWDRKGSPDPGTDWRMSRQSVWIVIGAVIADLVVRHTWSGALAYAVLFLLPPLISGLRESRAGTVFYDGHCALCHHFVRFLIAEDREGNCFRFSPLGSERFGNTVSEGIRETLPDSVVIVPGDGRVLTRFRAVVHALERLGGYWRVLGLVMRIVPGAVGNAVYDFIAARRTKLFGTKEEACPLIPEHLRTRFDF